MKRLRCALLGSVLVVAPSPPIGAAPQTQPVAASDLDPIVRDLCSRQVVLLGEDAGHGAGRTTEVKTAILRRLVSECGFSAVAFESQFYDFLDFDRQVRAGRAARQGLADAIGALWSRTREAQPLIDFLWERSHEGSLRVAGLDPQVGGVTGRFSQQNLAGELSTLLAEPERAACVSELSRHHAWTYDAANPFDEAAKMRLGSCADDIAQKADERTDPETAAMARSYRRYAEFAFKADGDARDLGMFENLEWLRSRWPAGTKVAVWTATVHAARAPTPALKAKPLGSRVASLLGVRAASIGFTAFGGTFGGPGGRGRSTALESPIEGSIEASASKDAPRAVRYLSADVLRRLGSAPARALRYGRYDTLDWSAVLDGLLVLADERAAELIR